MAKVVKATREVMDVNEELAKVTKKKEKKEEKKVSSKEKVKKTAKKTKKEKHGFLGFFKEVKQEMSKVVWPGKKDMIKYSIATIFFVIFFGGFFYLIEVIMALLKAWV